MPQHSSLDPRRKSPVSFLDRGLRELRVFDGDVMFYLRELSRPADERVNERGANRERQLHAVNVAVVLEYCLFGQARERRLGRGRDAKEKPRRRVEVEPLDSLFRDARNYNIGVALSDLLSAGRRRQPVNL
jgi:hypothetical protein